MQPHHCVVVEIDENQHRGYQESCECARLSEIVGGIGGRGVTVIRFNPDATWHDNRLLTFSMAHRLDMLVAVLKDELDAEPDKFGVNIIQLYFNVKDAGDYEEVRREDITTVVAV